MALIETLGGVRNPQAGRVRTTDPVEIRQRVRDYIDGAYVECGDIIPSVAGACVMVKCSKSMLSEWSINDQLLAGLLDELKVAQERALINGALSGEYNSNIAKLIMATHHGYSDKVDTTTIAINATISDPEAARRIAYAIASIDPVPMPDLRATIQPTPFGIFANNLTDTKD